MSWLLVTSAWPWPIRRGLQARSVQFAELLAGSGNVTLLAPAPAPQSQPSAPDAAFRVVPYDTGPLRWSAERLPRALAEGRSLQSGLFEPGDLLRKLAELAPRADRVLLQTVRFAGLLPRLARSVVALDLIDSLSLNFTSRARLDRPWLRPFWQFEARRLARDERRMIAGTAQSFVVSDRDRRHLVETLDAATANRLRVVPLVLEERPALARPPAPRQGDIRLLLTGNLGYFPTRHGLDWFLREVWPEVRRRFAGARLVVAGSRPPRGLVRRIVDAGAELVREPGEFASLLASVDLALAPLFAGSGTPMKLLEAIASGVPVLATPFAAAGLEMTIAPHVETAASAPDWVAAIDRAAADPESGRARARAARAAALRAHSRAAVAARLGGSAG